MSEQTGKKKKIWKGSVTKWADFIAKALNNVNLMKMMVQTKHTQPKSTILVAGRRNMLQEIHSFETSYILLVTECQHMMKITLYQ